MTDASTLTRIRVTRFGGPDVLAHEHAALPAVPPRGRVRVRITHASLGATDALARRGGYLLQPRAGFTPGYDLVGVVERTTPAAAARGLTEGVPVAAALPRMGAHASRIDVPARYLVPIPATLDPAAAAPHPLDLVTAALAWSLARPRAAGPVLVQGASGPVGAALVQTAISGGHPVYGTASPANRQVVEALGATWLDYRDPAWIDRLLDMAPAGVSAAIDHTGSRAVRRAVAADGSVVRLSFVGRPGRERADTFSGSLRTLAGSFARPRERLVSVPLFVAARPAAYRRMLAEQLDRIAHGAIVGPRVEVLPMTEAAVGHGLLESGLAGRKIVLSPEAGH